MQVQVELAGQRMGGGVIAQGHGPGFALLRGRGTLDLHREGAGPGGRGLPQADEHQPRLAGEEQGDGGGHLGLIGVDI